jgi:hypothetical protein
VARPLGQRRRQRQRGREEQRAPHALGVVGRQQQRALCRAAVGEEHARVDADGVEHRERVALEAAGPVRLDDGRSIGASVAARVEGDHPEVLREVRHLQLPEARVDDRPRRQQQQRVLAAAEDLVGDADTVDVGEPAVLGRDGARGRFDGVRKQHVSPPRAAARRRW